MSENITVRDALPADEASWNGLWAGYNAFYQMNVSAEITARTWQRILDSDSSLMCRIAEHNGQIVGFSISVLHEGTWVSKPICYLEDLFVDRAYRGLGIGRKLIEDLIALAETSGWSRLYWHTRQDNPARTLYDEFTKADDFVRYQIRF